jgi:hypothetical protein
MNLITLVAPESARRFRDGEGLAHQRVPRDEP